MKISAKLAECERTVAVDYELGSTLDESIELFGADVVHSRFVSAAVIDIQAVIRRLLKAAKTDDEIVEALGEYKIGVHARAVADPTSKAMKLLLKLSEADRERLLAELMGS